MSSSALDMIIRTKKVGTGDKEAVTAMGEMKNFSRGLGLDLSILNSSAELAGMAVKFFATQAAESVKLASDMNETVSKSNVIFGDGAGAIAEFAETASYSLGQTKKQAIDAAATFATFGKGAGLAGDDLVDFSTTLVGLSADLASFSNTSPEEAITAIGAALRGESEPIRRYGVLLDDATLKQKAMEMGLISTTKNALTPQQKALASYQVILAQTTDAQGDFARTSDGLANQQKILTAQIEDLKTEIGEGLLPATIEATSALNDLLKHVKQTAVEQDNLTRAFELGLIAESEYEAMSSTLMITQDEVNRRLEEYNLTANATYDVEMLRATSSLPEVKTATEDVAVAIQGEASAMWDSAEAGGNLTGILGEVKEANQKLWENINTNIDSTIANWLESINFFKAGGWEIQKQFEETKQKLVDGKITPAEAEAYFEMFFSEAQAVQVELGNITAEEAAANIASTLNVSLEKANELLTAINENAQFNYTSYIHIITTEERRDFYAGGSAADANREERASGGPVRPGGTYTVGENGPETLVMGANGGYVYPTTHNWNLTINQAGRVTDPASSFAMMQSLAGV